MCETQENKAPCALPDAPRAAAVRLECDELAKILPHRYPFALVDRITDVEPGRWAMGRKCVSGNEAYFNGHFPGHKVMPGVLMLEAMAQVGAVALLLEPENAGGLVLFGGVKNARFRREVKPGDVLELTCELTARHGRVGTGVAKARVEGRLAAQAELTFAIVPPEQ